MVQNKELVPNSLNQGMFQKFRDFAKGLLNSRHKLTIQ